VKDRNSANTLHAITDDRSDALDCAHASRYRPVLLRYFRRHLGSHVDAEDLAQEALMRLMRTPTRADNPEAYLLRIASNLLRDRFRRDRTRQSDQHDSLEEGIHELQNEEPGTDRVYEGRERLERFVSALGGLPPRCRQVFLLQRYEGMTYTAIAKRLQISVSAVEKHMMRALLHLQTQLAEP
jgi:RNA polymerase sigma factor (sigma-70 family)